MKHQMLGLLLCAVLAGFGTFREARAGDDVATYFDSECVDCHHRKKKPIEDKHMSRDEWRKAIDKMNELEKLDPEPSKEFVGSLLDWLEKTHGPSNTTSTASKPASGSTDKQ